MTVALKGDLTPGTAVPHPIRVASLLPLSSGGVGSGNGMRMLTGGNSLLLESAE